MPDVQPPDASIPVAVDAAPDATVIDATPPCSCPSAEVLWSDRIIRRAFQSFARGGAVSDCTGDGELTLGGGCFVDELGTELQAQGFSKYNQSSLDANFWTCAWNTRDGELRSHVSTAVCLTGTSPGLEPPPGCDCPVVEPLEDRVIRSEQTGTIPAGMIKQIRASCPTDEPLMGGSCILPFRVSGENNFTELVSTGFARDEAGKDVWECSWSNGSTASVNPSVVALCLRPPMAGTAPEAEPTASRLVQVEQRDTLPAGTSFLQEATCADGDFLLRGGCTIEDPEAAPRDLSIFRSGFLPDEANRPNTWQCGWNNPSSSTPTAIATALCLKPPSAP